MKPLRCHLCHASRVVLLTLLLAALSALTVAGGTHILVNETFDPPSVASLFGWEDPNLVAGVSRDYVPVARSTAAQISAELLGPGAYVGTMLCQNPVVVGGDLSTPQNTTLSFDIMVDRPGLRDVVVGLQSWGGYLWNTFKPDETVTSSLGRVPLVSYTPGKYKTIVIPIDDPLWILDTTFPGTLTGPFDPSGKTCQIFVQVDSDGLPDLGQFTLTIDNIQITTKSDMVPFQAACAGRVTYHPSGAVTIAEEGVASHVGAYSESLSFIGPGTAVVELTAANGDKLFGKLYVLTDITGDPVFHGVTIEDGTGRFEGAVGSYLVTAEWVDPLVTFTATAEGSLSSVGPNKE